MLSRKKIWNSAIYILSTAEKKQKTNGQVFVRVKCAYFKLSQWVQPTHCPFIGREKSLLQTSELTLITWSNLKK